MATPPEFSPSKFVLERQKRNTMHIANRLAILPSKHYICVDPIDIEVF
jgi:hypothetical protein